MHNYIYIHYIYDQYKHMLFNINLFLTICKIKCSAFKTGMKHLIHVLCQTFAYKNWLLYLIVNTPYCFSACDVHFYPHFEVDQIIHGRMPPKAQQVIDEILMEAFISVTSLSYTDESIHQTRELSGFFFPLL